MWDCTSVFKEKNRSGLVKRTMNREEMERGWRGNARAGTGGTTPGSDLIDSGVEQLEGQLHFSHHALNLHSAARPNCVCRESRDAAQQLL